MERVRNQLHLSFSSENGVTMSAKSYTLRTPVCLGVSKKDTKASKSCTACLLHRVHYLPVVTFGFFLFAFLTSYAIAVSLNHAEAFVPYISYTANEVPSKNIFAQLINLGAILLFANMAIRYLQTRAYLELTGSEPEGEKVNSASVVSGSMSVLGLTVVANFPATEVKIVHNFGAFMAFCLGVVYCWLQTILSLRIRRRSPITCLQLVLCSAVTVILIISLCSKIIYRVQESEGVGTKYDSLKAVYLVSTITQWLIALIIISFGLTFYPDFSNIRLTCSTLEVINTDLVRQSVFKGDIPFSV